MKKLGTCPLSIMWCHMIYFLDSTEKEVENKKAYEMFEKQHVLKTGKTVSATPTERDGNYSNW